MKQLARQQGLSLIELMVSITIGLLIVAGLVGLVASTSASRSELEKLNLQIENGRYAFETLAEDIRHAGYFGVYQPLRADPPPTTTPDACATTVAAMTTSLNFAVQGISNYGAANTAAVRSALYSCLPAAAIVGGTDVLAIRRTSTTSIALSNAGVPTPSITANAPYFQSGMVPDANPTQFTVSYVLAVPTGSPVSLSTFMVKTKDAGTGTNAGNPATFNTPAPLQQFVVHIYFVSPCSQAVLDCTGGDGIPSLKRLALGAGPAFPTVPEVIAAGIEDFQVDYGLNTGSQQVTATVTGTYYDGSVNTFLECNPTSSSAYESTACFQDVVALRIHLLARNSEISPGYTDTRTYDMGVKGSVGPRNDRYKRHVYTGLVRINSRAMGRECTPKYDDPC